MEAASIRRRFDLEAARLRCRVFTRSGGAYAAGARAVDLIAAATCVRGDALYTRNPRDGHSTDWST